MKNNFGIGAIIGFAAGAAAAVAGTLTTLKVADEIKDGMGEQRFESPEGDNFVTLSCGSSKTAKGLTLIRVKAMTESGEDECKLLLFAKKMPEAFSVDWTDNEHCRLLVGNGKRKQCCDVSFEEKEISAVYYLSK